MKKKILCLLIALVMSVSSFSVMAYAADETDGLETLKEEILQLKEENAQLKKELDEIKKEKPEALSPNIIISAFNFGKGSVSGGKAFNLSYTLKNTSSSIIVQNVIIKVSGGETFTIASGSDTTEVNSIPANGSVSKSVSLIAGVNKDSGTYPVDISISFEYYDNQKKSEGKSDLSIAVPLSQEDKFSVNNIGMGKEVYVEKEQNVTFSLVNTGATALKNVYISVLDTEGKVLANSFYGSVEPSAQMEDGAKLLVTPEKEGENKYTLKVEYEDKLSNKKEYVKEFTVDAKVYENPFEEADDTSADITDEKPSSKKWVYIGSAAGIVAIAVVTTVIVKKKKAKKNNIDNDEL